MYTYVCVCDMHVHTHTRLHIFWNPLILRPQLHLHLELLVVSSAPVLTSLLSALQAPVWGFVMRGNLSILVAGVYRGNKSGLRGPRWLQTHYTVVGPWHSHADWILQNYIPVSAVIALACHSFWARVGDGCVWRGRLLSGPSEAQSPPVLLPPQRCRFHMSLVTGCGLSPPHLYFGFVGLTCHPVLL